jgi:hypothetical protein
MAGPGVLLDAVSPTLEELPNEDNGGLDAELDEEVSSGTEDDDDSTVFGEGGRPSGWGEAVLAMLEFVSGGPVLTEPALETVVDDGRDWDIAR